MAPPRAAQLRVGQWVLVAPHVALVAPHLRPAVAVSTSTSASSSTSSSDVSLHAFDLSSLAGRAACVARIWPHKALVEVAVALDAADMRLTLRLPMHCIVVHPDVQGTAQ